MNRFALLAMVPACMNAHAGSVPEPAPKALVSVAPVVRGSIEHPLHGAGLVYAERELSLGFKVGGVVSQVRVDVGAKVKKGDVLATVDASEFAAGALQASEGVKKAERDLERIRGLHERGTLPLSDAQNAETGVSVAKAALAAAQVNVGRGALIAPTDGVISMRAIEPGEVVPSGKPVFHLSGTKAGHVVRVGLSDHDLRTVTLGAPCTATLDADPEHALACEVSEVANSAAPSTGLFDVEVRIKSFGAPLRSGSSAKVQIVRVFNDAVSLPVSALVDGQGDQAAVFVVQDGRAVRKPVTVAFLVNDRAVLRGGLENETAVVSAGAGRLRGGSEVKIQ
jgi:RND family efflux transporter MFP subunit